MAKFKETLECKILKESADEPNRTVIAGVLEGDFLSANKRFYPEAIVRKVAETLNGKPSMIGHDTNSPRDVVARISNSTMSGKRLIASFKFGSDASSNEMFQKVKEGLVDSYSIRAYGESKPGVINGEAVDIVQELELESVDLVVTPGISSAKVLKVFESAPEITYNKEEDVEAKELQAQLDEANRKLKEAQDAGLVLEQAKAKAESEKQQAELSSQIASDISTIKEEYRASIKESFSGKDKESWTKHFEAQKKLIESICKTAKISEDIIISPKDKDKSPKKYRSINDTLESDELTKEDKAKILSSYFGIKKAA